MSTALQNRIIETIRAEGPLPFERFMDICLYEPHLGYYARDEVPIGKAGDFYTSPHVHPLFGAMLGRQMEEFWELLGRPDPFDVVEQGPGLGYLARDLLDHLASGTSRGGPRRLYEMLRYTLVERNPAYASAQQELLVDHEARVSWHGSLADVPPFTGCLVSNELLDAFPVRIIKAGDPLLEVHVDEREGSLVERLEPAGEQIIKYVNNLQPRLPDGYRTEVNLRMKSWLEEAAARLKHGFILTIDYGYTAGEYFATHHNRGTLLSYRGHEAVDSPYDNVGDQDMTSHVNFSDLARYGEAAGLKTLGFAPQGMYLVSLGIDELLKRYTGDRPDPRQLASAKHLFMPQGLGESHQVIAQYRGSGEPDLRGFGLRNLTGRL